MTVTVPGASCTDWTYDANWATGYGVRSRQKALYKGGSETLNVYVVESIDADRPPVAGRTILPGRSNGNRDGVTIVAATVPNANIYPCRTGYTCPYHQGRKLVHEVGHWLGLLHTFQGGDCEGEGDFVDDTPAQLEPPPDGMCRTRQDSCPKQIGMDPENNFMDNLTDECATQFTPGQIARMHDMWNTYRGPDSQTLYHNFQSWLGSTAPWRR
ncbi:hypothetical protein DCS_08216 [Drechmeria coniospora]|uniref:Peptidase M43 pregnancy-associated plasma-A domain-containing protein n=1 Tax=Drechmeria coniospora TaxID=98403 RepID=A0A151GGQ5_DRECN|nr:hypothetical protein DCS_08216 [Drechmeria coniospora]KYK56246.1 hypothetical protein DCS_08216 [Drechmeria coniospora]